MNLNQNQTSIKVTIPYGMTLHASGIPQEYILTFAYSDVPALVAFAKSVLEDCKRIQDNAEKFLKPVEAHGCQHPKERLKFTPEGVFCLDCNESVLAPVKNATPALSGVLSRASAPAVLTGSNLVPVEVDGQKILVPAKVAPKGGIAQPITHVDWTPEEGTAEKEETTIPQESEPKKDA